MRPLVKGDRVRLTIGGQTEEAIVLIASENGRSMAFAFEAILGGNVGRMLTLQDDTGVHRDLITNAPVKIERVA